MNSDKILTSLLRPSLSGILNKCKKCNLKVIDLVMEKIAGKKIKSCLKCRIHAGWLYFLISKSINFKLISGRKIMLLDAYARKYITNLLEGIHIFGFRKPLIYGAPLFVTWNITKKCNLKCGHCYHDSDINFDAGLGTEQVYKGIDKLADLNVIGIFFGGGEPFIRKDFLDILEYARKKRLFIHISTNATLINDKIARKLKEINVERITVSLDGLQGTHDKIRGVKGTFKRTLNGIKILKKYGLNVAIAATVTRINVKEIPKILELAKELKVNSFLLNNFVPCGRGNMELDITPLERESILKNLYNELLMYINEENGMECMTGASPFYSRIALQTKTKKTKIIPASGITGINSINRYGIYIKNPGEFYSLFNKYCEYVGACIMGTSYLTIGPKGEIWPCTLLPIVIGNIFKDDLKKIWIENKVLNEVRKRKNYKGPCKDCKYKVCRGCRARAYAYYNDYLESDPGCLWAAKKRENN